MEPAGFLSPLLHTASSRSSTRLEPPSRRGGVTHPSAASHGRTYLLKWVQCLPKKNKSPHFWERGCVTSHTTTNHLCYCNTWLRPGTLVLCFVQTSSHRQDRLRTGGMVAAPSQLVLRFQLGTTGKHRLYPVLAVFPQRSREFSSGLWVFLLLFPSLHSSTSRRMEAEMSWFWTKKGPTGSQGEIRKVLCVHESQTGTEGREVEMSSTISKSLR